MKYEKITIHKYKGIKKPLIIDFSKSNLIPIIECGKTTILEGLLAFDRFNDNNYNRRHIEHIQNLYETKKSDILISAMISYNYDKLKTDLLKFVEDESNNDDEDISEEEKQNFRNYAIPKIAELKNQEKVEIFRLLNDFSYSFSSTKSIDFEDKLCKEIVRISPFMLYFDDFRDDFNGYVKITNTEEGEDVTTYLWYKIVNNLFEKTNPEFSISTYLNAGDQQKNILSDVTQYLNSILNKSWSNFSLEKGTPPVVEISKIVGGKLYFEIIEKIKEKGNSFQKSRHFGLKERSKGFYWFFNFIMKLHFNPSKRYSRDKDTIYLLDEPGSYLHSTAQKNLLVVSQEQKVEYICYTIK